VNCIEDFVTPDNTATLLTKEMHAVVDDTGSEETSSSL